jgi:hypothetical protein
MLRTTLSTPMVPCKSYFQRKQLVLTKRVEEWFTEENQVLGLELN